MPAAILLLAANTAYNDFPRVLFLLARDRYAPRMFLRMGNRLAFRNGVIVLSATAAAIFAVFGGKTEPVIPLYGVGVPGLHHVPGRDGRAGGATEAETVR